MKNIDTSSHRTPPHSLEAEAAILGGILLDNNALDKCLSAIGIDDFYSVRNQIIFRTLCLLSNSGTPADSVILANFLKERGELEKAGGPSYLADLQDNSISGANIDHYCRIVKDNSVLRQTAAAAVAMLDDIYSANGLTPGEILDDAQRSLMEISIEQRKNDVRGSREVCRSTMKGIEKNFESKTLITGLSTGYRDLDIWTSGLQDSELVIIAGRPGMGKTAMGGNIAQNVVLSGAGPVVIFSLETSGEALMTRIFSSRTGIDSRRLRRGSLSGGDWPRLVQVVDEVSRAPLFIDDSSTLTPMQLKSRARRLKVEHGLKLIIVDYLQLMTVSGRHETREREIAEISRSLKALSKELQIPVVVLSQLNRQVENRPSRRPGLADLRESGALEQDADLILFLYRDDVYNQAEDNPERGIAEIIVGKQRNGPVGKIKMRFDQRLTRFSDLENTES
jgi:replicative DNA helicase